ncbi:MAG: T9SS type A sorting domain-containing protein, partial [Bacteroidetes bacterium]|nr:T9SS type A sorting domain-containing protein [Bacteroidota bacterium]
VLTRLDVYPTPLRSGKAAAIEYSVAKPGMVQFALYDALGRRIQELPARQSEAGSFIMHFLPDIPAPGLYFLQMRCGDHIRNRKIVVHM